MERFLAGIRRFIQELRRRRVIQVAALYATTAFVTLQLAEILAEPFMRDCPFPLHATMLRKMALEAGETHFARLDFYI